LCNQHDFGAQCPHHQGALLGITLRHHRNEGALLRRADDGGPVPVLPLVSSTTGWPGEQSFRDGVFDDLPRDAVLFDPPGLR
jgi:hypothetical protein